jgi:hypothetical protein
MPWNPMNMVLAAEDAGVCFDVDDTWLDVNPYGNGFQPVGVVWHHTSCSLFAKGDMPSLSLCRFPSINTTNARIGHIVVGRSGYMQIIAGMGAQHLNSGGPLNVQGVDIAEDEGNKYFIGIEIEASSTYKLLKKNVTTPKLGMTPAQFEATSRFCAALFDRLNWDTSAAIRHQDWSVRNNDVGLSIDLLQSKIDSYRKPKELTPTQEPKEKQQAVKLLKMQPSKKSEDIKVVQRALKKEFPHSAILISGFLDGKTQDVYKQWQRKCGFSQEDSDGSPSRDSLSKLGRKYNFKVQ